MNYETERVNIDQKKVSKPFRTKSIIELLLQDDAQSSPDERLVQFHVRLQKSTREQVELISEEVDVSQGHVLRLALQFGLNFTLSGIVDYLKCVNCSEKLVRKDNRLVCESCDLKIEVK